MYRTSTLSLDRLRREVDLLEPDLPLALASVDIDGFGPLNERDGAEAGDRVLAQIEAALVAGLPPGAPLGHAQVTPRRPTCARRSTTTSPVTPSCCDGDARRLAELSAAHLGELARLAELVRLVS